MNGQTTVPDDQVMAECLREMEVASDPAAVLKAFCERYPHRASDLRAVAAADERLRASSPHGEESPPEKLGDFWIVGRIDSGGMGVVYKAIQEPFGRPVAVKIMRQKYTGEVANARFLREQQAYARLHHTHILGIIAAGQEEDARYFATPLIDGINLHKKRCTLSFTAWTDKQKQGHCRWVARLIADIADALEHAHNKGVIHRDIKPSNIMIERDEYIWLIDFSIADVLIEGTETQASDSGLSLFGDYLGTPDYMAPEQLDKRADYRTDIWGLGAVMYELLTLHRAYSPSEVDSSSASCNDSPIARRRREFKAPLLPPRALVPSIPRDLAAICERCLQQKPEDRYHSAKDLAQDLRRFLRGDRPMARDWSLIEHTVRWARRQPAHALLTTLGLLLFASLSLVIGQIGQLHDDNARHADKLARAVGKQLRLADRAVMEAAARPTLQACLARHPANPELLQTEITALAKKAAHWFQRPGEEQPFVNWFVLDRDGCLVAIPNQDPSHPVVGQNFAFRDYARQMLSEEAPADPQAVLISKVFRSHQDKKFKFAAVGRIWNPNQQFLGLIVATVAIDSKLVALDMRDESNGCGLIAPVDRQALPGKEAETADLPQYVFALHRIYDGDGFNPIQADDRRAILDGFTADPTKTRYQKTLLRNGLLWLSDYVRVGRLPFVVVSDEPYPWEVNLTLYVIALALTGIATAAAWRGGRRIRQLIAKGA